jgi:hypothetical protein
MAFALGLFTTALGLLRFTAVCCAAASGELRAPCSVCCVLRTPRAHFCILGRGPRAHFYILHDVVRRWQLAALAVVVLVVAVAVAVAGGSSAGEVGGRVKWTLLCLMQMRLAASGR